MSAKHEGLRAWFEVLRTSREGLMPKYQVHQESTYIHCSNPECKGLTAGEPTTASWVLRQRGGPGYLYAFRHQESCPWRQRVGISLRYSFTTKPLERAYVYWAQLEHKLNHK